MGIILDIFIQKKNLKKSDFSVSKHGKKYPKRYPEKYPEKNPKKYLDFFSILLDGRNFCLLW